MKYRRKEIDKILLANFTERDWQTARKQLLNLFIVSNCKHENEIMRQGDGFVYGVCGDCGKDLY